MPRKSTSIWILSGLAAGGLATSVLLPDAGHRPVTDAATIMCERVENCETPQTTPAPPVWSLSQFPAAGPASSPADLALRVGEDAERLLRRELEKRVAYESVFDACRICPEPRDVISPSTDWVSAVMCQPGWCVP